MNRTSRAIGKPVDGEREAYSAKEIARLWGVSESLIYKEQDAGRLPYVRIGTARRVRADDLAAYLKANRVGR